MRSSERSTRFIPFALSTVTILMPSSDELSSSITADTTDATFFTCDSLPGEVANANKTTSIYNSVYQNPILQLDETGSYVLSFYLKMMKDLIQFQSNPYRLDAAKHLTLTLFFGYVHRIHALENEKNGYANNIVNEFITLLKKIIKKRGRLVFMPRSYV